MATAVGKARGILRKYWNDRVPVDPEAIARRLGADVRGEGLDFEPGGPLSGRFDFEGDTPVIRYNEADIPVRQRFTIAHELGHLVLSHGGGFRDPKQSFSLDNYDPREAACNRFAAELLMPALAIKHYITELNIDDIKSLAQEFNVSEVAMKYRLKSLGWITAA